MRIRYPETLRRPQIQAAPLTPSAQQKRFLNQFFINLMSVDEPGAIRGGILRIEQSTREFEHPQFKCFTTHQNKGMFPRQRLLLKIYFNCLELFKECSHSAVERRKH